MPYARWTRLTRRPARNRPPARRSSTKAATVWRNLRRCSGVKRGRVSYVGTVNLQDARSPRPVGRGRWWLFVLKGVGEVVCSAVVDGPGSGALVRVGWRGSRLEADAVVGGAVGAQHSHGRRQLPSRSFIRSFHFC